MSETRRIKSSISASASSDRPSFNKASYLKKIQKRMTKSTLRKKE